MVGKVLNDKNQSSLKQVHNVLTKMLLESGVPCEDLLLAFEDSQLKGAEQIISASGSFTESIKERVWYDNFLSAVDLIESRICDRGAWGMDDGQTPAQVKAALLLDIAEFKTTIELYLTQISDEKSQYDLYCGGRGGNSPSQVVRASISSSLSDAYRFASWRENIALACGLFRDYVWRLNYESNLNKEQKITAGTSLLSEFCKISIEAIDKAPACGDSIKASLGSAPKEESSTLPQIEVTPQAIDSMEHSDERVKIEIKCSALQANAEKLDLNKQPFSGVLFRVDELSDGAPASGPTTKLYISREVAQVAADIINASGGMPLDIRGDMSGHDDSNITGIMTSAALVGKDFVVYGHLFPYNKPQEAMAIAAHIRDLGMSINAEASSHHELMLNPVTGETETVAVIDELYPLGANILFSKLATWQSTQVLAASRAPTDASLVSSRTTQASGETPEIGSANPPLAKPTSKRHASLVSSRTTQASGETPDDVSSLSLNSNNMTTPNSNQNNLESIQTLLSNFIQASQEETKELKLKLVDGLNGISDRVASLEASAAERDAVVESLKAEKAAAQAQEEQKRAELEAKTQGEQMAQLVAAAVQKAINPNAHPASLTSVEPLVAGGAPSNRPAVNSDLEVQLIQAQARMEAFEAGGILSPERIKTSDEIKRLKAQLHRESGLNSYNFAS